MKAPQQPHRRQHQRLDLRMSAEVRTANAAFTATTGFLPSALFTQ